MIKLIFITISLLILMLVSYIGVSAWIRGTKSKNANKKKRNKIS